MRTTEREAVLRHFFRKEVETPLDGQITAVLIEMERIGVAHQDYPKLIDQLEQLNEIKAKHRRDPVKIDTIWMVLGNIGGILLIVAYEQKHVFASKGFTQIIRPKP